MANRSSLFSNEIKILNTNTNFNFISMKKLLISTLILTLAACTNKSSNIVGRWQTKSPKGNILTAVFKADYTYEGYFNKELFTKGTYSFKDPVITFEDDKMATPCSAVKGSYKLTFFADTAVRFNVINDNCAPRNEGTNGVVFVRMKE